MKIIVLSRNSLIVWAVLFPLVLGIGCKAWGGIPSNRPYIQAIITSLESDKPEEREAAAKQLEEMGKRGMSAEEGMIALRAAVKKYPPRKYDFQDSAADLISAVAAHPSSEYIPVIKELYPKYGNEAKIQALTLLARLDDRNAAVAYMDIVRSYARSGGVPSLATQPLETKPRYADVFFPELLNYADIPAFEWDVYYLSWKYFRENLLSPDDLLPYSKQVLDSYRVYEDRLKSSQQDEGIAWMWDDSYQEWRDSGALLLDLLGYFAAPEVESELREALAYHDPRLKCFTALSLLRQGKEVDKTVAMDIAKSAEMRNILYDELERMGKLSLFPEEYRTQEAFAESDMVNWLTFPTELGRVPDEIEMMKVVTIDTGTKNGILEYYVFRFRTYPPHWAAEDGWMAGVSGPFLQKDKPTTESLGDTFSSFEAWDSKSPEEHVGSLQELIKRWKEYQAK